MQGVVHGVYKNGQVVFNEPVTADENSNVIVVFTKNQESTVGFKKNPLIEMLDALGPWDDSRDAEEIIADIENNRSSRSFDITI